MRLPARHRHCFPIPTHSCALGLCEPPRPLRLCAIFFRFQLFHSSTSFALLTTHYAPLPLRPLFSSPYKSLFQQLLCFLIYTNPPGVPPTSIQKERINDAAIR